MGARPRVGALGDQLHGDEPLRRGPGRRPRRRRPPERGSGEPSWTASPPGSTVGVRINPRIGARVPGVEVMRTLRGSHPPTKFWVLPGAARGGPRHRTPVRPHDRHRPHPRGVPVSHRCAAPPSTRRCGVSVSATRMFDGRGRRSRPHEHAPAGGRALHGQRLGLGVDGACEGQSVSRPAGRAYMTARLAHAEARFV